MHHIDLNALPWKCGQDGHCADIDARVPGCIHADLLANGKIPDPFWGTNELQLQWVGQRNWQYITHFDLHTDALKQEHIELVAEGLDTLASVYLNGTLVAKTDNMFIGYRWNVKPLLRAKNNEIKIVFADAEEYIRTHYTDHHPRECNDPVGRCTVMRKEQCQFGWDWGPRLITAGIWRPIRLEAWSGNRIEHLKIVQRHPAKQTSDSDATVQVRVGAELASPSHASTLRATLSLNGKTVATAQIETTIKGKAESTSRSTAKAVQSKRVDGQAAEATTADKKSSRIPAFDRMDPQAAAEAIRKGNTEPVFVCSEKSENPLAGLPELVLEVRDPQLWWPAGHGAQVLYHLHVELLDTQTGEVLDTAIRRIGLRTIELDRSADEWGNAFQFVVNGRAIFAKGANWIPAHSFVAPLQRQDYERDISAAAAVHMNMLRVWGGGIYESEDFYDLCEEYGLLVWQDFAFACSLTPDADSFRDNVRAEARYQIRRLHYRTALALWCGNNELVQINRPELNEPAGRLAYEKIFHDILPQELAEQDGITCYWPSSEWRGRFSTGHADGEISGDTHFWDVWHARHPVKDYEKWKFRFCSEFGMQSYSSVNTQNTFCAPQDANIFGPVMENHQKNRAGNQIIFDYISRRYRFPADQAKLIYLSQINQAYCMSVGIEHFRRNSPRCMGALYWQLNDCWPVASWSSIEFTGAWKALHYHARRFFAPALVSAHIIDEESTTIGNYRKPCSGKIDLYTVYDAPEATNATLRWELRDLHSAAIIASHAQDVRLEYGQSICQQKLDFAAELAEHGADNMYLRILLERKNTAADLCAATDRNRNNSENEYAASNANSASDNTSAPTEILSEETVFFAPPRFLNLPQAKTKITARALGGGQFELSFTSDAFQHRFAFELPGMVIRASDNFFELYPQITKTVTLTAPPSLSKTDLLARLTHMSL